MSAKKKRKKDDETASSRVEASWPMVDGESSAVSPTDSWARDQLPLLDVVAKEYAPLLNRLQSLYGASSAAMEISVDCGVAFRLPVALTAASSRLGVSKVSSVHQLQPLHVSSESPLLRKVSSLFGAVLAGVDGVVAVWQVWRVLLKWSSLFSVPQWQPVAVSSESPLHNRCSCMVLFSQIQVVLQLSGRLEVMRWMQLAEAS